MADLVTLDEAKAYLRVDHDDEDEVIALLISAASEAVQDVASDFDPNASPLIVPDRIKLAVLARVGVAYDDRPSMAAGAGELPMLTPLRRLET